MSYKSLEYFLGLNYDIIIEKLEDEGETLYVAFTRELDPLVFRGVGDTVQEAVDSLEETKKDMFPDYFKYDPIPKPRRSTEKKIVRQTETLVKETEMTFTPLSDRILIKPIPVEEMLASGLIMASTDVNKTPTTGIVVAVGPGRVENDTIIDMNVDVGDQVMWSKFAGSNVTIDGEKLLLMRESDISGILTWICPKCGIQYAAEEEAIECCNIDVTS